MKVLLSIKPEFTDKIFNGLKKYEYRRQIFKRNDINKIVVYESAPTSAIVGEFEIEKVIFNDLNTLWKKTKNYSGISEDYFFSYFSNKEKGYAIEIKSYEKYKSPISLKNRYGLLPPQSFLYLNDE